MADDGRTPSTENLPLEKKGRVQLSFVLFALFILAVVLAVLIFGGVKP